MNLVGRKFLVRDAQGRNWGTVTMTHSHECPLGNDHNYSGRLTAAPEFAEVQPLFLRFDALFQSSQGKESELDELTDQILDLDVELLEESDQKTSIRGLVTVDDKLLLTYQPRVKP